MTGYLLLAFVVIAAIVLVVGLAVTGASFLDFLIHAMRESS